MSDLRAALAAYARFYETMTPQTLPDIAGLLAPNARFKDPFNDVRGAEQVIALLTMMYRHGTPRFEVLDQAVSERAGYLLWRYTSDPGGNRPPWVIDGMSELRFDTDGRVIEHVDHWDAASQFYERLPLVGWLIRRVKRRLRVGPA
ncbi:MAG: nuclear transport factor 2 family protein [Alphaproteobacteria bacterium]|nr:nuclear transport factor 2 family protein [Alphaproteobacteria bacterium]